MDNCNEDVEALRARVHNLNDKFNEYSLRLSLTEDRLDTLKTTFNYAVKVIDEFDDRFHKMEMIIDRLERSINAYNKVLWVTFMSMVGMLLTTVAPKLLT